MIEKINTFFHTKIMFVFERCYQENRPQTEFIRCRHEFNLQGEKCILTVKLKNKYMKINVEGKIKL